MKKIIDFLLRATYGIKLKWEPHGDTVVWGEGALKVSGDNISINRKGMTPSLHILDEAPEWST